MSAIDERVASIRMFTVPRRPVRIVTVYQYAAVAADWERLRLRVRHNPLPVLADDERFSVLSVTMRRLSAELGLKTCTTTTASSDGIAGITGWQGFLPNDRATCIPIHGSRSTEDGAAERRSGAWGDVPTASTPPRHGHAPRHERCCGVSVVSPLPPTHRERMPRRQCQCWPVAMAGAWQNTRQGELVLGEPHPHEPMGRRWLPVSKP